MQRWSVVESYRRTLDFYGRSRRRELVFFQLWQVLFCVGLAVVNTYGLEATDSQAFNLACAAIFLLFTAGNALPIIAIGVRRLHDSGREGWLLAFVAIPLVNLYLLWLLFQPGDPQANRFGEPRPA